MTKGTMAKPLPFAAVSTPTATLSGWPVDNVGTQPAKDAAVFTASPAEIDIDLGQQEDVTVAALVATDATNWILKGADTQANLDTAPEIVNESLPGAGAGVETVFFDGAVHSHRWWRVTISGTADLALGRVILSPAFIPTYTFSYGLTRGRAPGLEFGAAADNSPWPRQRKQRRRWTVTFEDITDFEYTSELDAIDAYAAGGGEMLFSMDPDSPTPNADSLYCLMSIADGAQRRRKNRWRAPIVLEELT